MRSTLICKRLGCKRVSSKEEGHHRGRKQQLLLLLAVHLGHLLVRPPLTGMSRILLFCVLLHHCYHSPSSPIAALQVWDSSLLCFVPSMLACTMPCNDVLSILLFEQSWVLMRCGVVCRYKWLLQNLQACSQSDWWVLACNVCSAWVMLLFSLFFELGWFFALHFAFILCICTYLLWFFLFCFCLSSVNMDHRLAVYQDTSGMDDYVCYNLLFDTCHKTT